MKGNNGQAAKTTGKKCNRDEALPLTGNPA